MMFFCISIVVSFSCILPIFSLYSPFRLLLFTNSNKPGNLKIGETIDIGYVSQNRYALSEDKTVYEEISNGVDEIDMGDGSTISTRHYAACFHFRGVEQEKKIHSLSGGERNRVYLAKMLNRGIAFFMYLDFLDRYETRGD